MAAAVGRAGLLVAQGVAGNDHSVQLAHDGNPDLGLFALQGGDDAGDGHPVPVLEAQFVKDFFHLIGGFKLLVAQFRLHHNGFAQGDDLIPVFIDGFTGSFL